MNATTTDRRAALIAAADRAYSPYRQWAGHWDDWLLATFLRDRFTMGVTLFKRHEAALVAPQPCEEHEDCRVAYSVLRMLDVHVPTRYFRIEPTHAAP